MVEKFDLPGSIDIHRSILFGRNTKYNIFSFDLFLFRWVGWRGSEVAVFVDIGDHILEGYCSSFCFFYLRCSLRSALSCFFYAAFFLFLSC